MQLRMGMLLLALLVQGAAMARDEAKPGLETYESLKKEMADAQKKVIEAYQKQVAAAQEAYKKALEEAKTDEEKANAKKLAVVPAFSMENSPVSKFAARFLAWAQKNPEDPKAFAALMDALRATQGPDGKAKDTWVATLAVLENKLALKPGDDLNMLIRMLGSVNDPASTKLLRTVMEKNPDRKTQGLAGKSILRGKESELKMVNLIESNPQYRTLLETNKGKEEVARLIARRDQIKTAAEEFKSEFNQKFSDLFPDLSVGKTAPEVVSKDLDGKPVKLSALRGKVVVLDIWATWCGPCRAMIPHEREMTEKLKDKPFVLVSISADEKLETLTKFLDKEKMPWSHWWNGSQGGILQDWDVQFFPTIYVLDAKGVIRHTNIRGNDLETAVEKLLAEIESKKESK